MQVINFEQYGDENEVFGLVWTARGVSDTDYITASTWTIPSGLTSSNAQFTNTTTQIQIGGGVSNISYTLVNKITTLSGQIKECKMTLVVS